MSYNVVVFCCCDCNRDISDLGVSGTLGYLLSDLMSLRKLYCLWNFSFCFCWFDLCAFLDFGSITLVSLVLLPGM